VIKVFYPVPFFFLLPGGVQGRTVFFFFSTFCRWPALTPRGEEERVRNSCSFFIFFLPVQPRSAFLPLILFFFFPAVSRFRLLPTASSNETPFFLGLFYPVLGCRTFSLRGWALVTASTFFFLFSPHGRSFFIFLPRSSSAILCFSGIFFFLLHASPPPRTYPPPPGPHAPPNPRQPGLLPRYVAQ